METPSSLESSGQAVYMKKLTLNTIIGGSKMGSQSSRNGFCLVGHTCEPDDGSIYSGVC
jgi:hypothetical protein